jgi:hypothetical protein
MIAITLWVSSICSCQTLQDIRIFVYSSSDVRNSVRAWHADYKTVSFNTLSFFANICPKDEEKTAGLAFLVVFTKG